MVNIPKSLRREICTKQNSKCNLCGCKFEIIKVEYEEDYDYWEFFDVDHIIPRALGGKTTIENLQAICLECHRKKTKDDMKNIWNLKKGGNKQCKLNLIEV